MYRTQHQYQYIQGSCHLSWVKIKSSCLSVSMYGLETQDTVLMLVSSGSMQPLCWLKQPLWTASWGGGRKITRGCHMPCIYTSLPSGLLPIQLSQSALQPSSHLLRTRGRPGQRKSPLPPALLQWAIMVAALQEESLLLFVQPLKNLGRHVGDGAETHHSFFLFILGPLSYHCSSNPSATRTEANKVRSSKHSGWEMRRI